MEEGHDVTDVMYISLSYKTPYYVKRDTTKELWKSGYGYMMKYHQYYFQPDQRGYVAKVDEGNGVERICVLSSMVEDFCETFGFGKNVKPAKGMNYVAHFMTLGMKQMEKEKLQKKTV